MCYTDLHTRTHQILHFFLHFRIQALASSNKIKSSCPPWLRRETALLRVWFRPRVLPGNFALPLSLPVPLTKPHLFMYCTALKRSFRGTDSKIFDNKGYLCVFIPSSTPHSVSPTLKQEAIMTLQADKSNTRTSNKFTQTACIHLICSVPVKYAF